MSSPQTAAITAVHGWFPEDILSNADLALSVAMTTASTLVSVVALPLNLALYITTLYGRTVAVDMPGLILACAVVVCAVISGYFVSKHFPTRRQLVSSM